MNYFPQKDRSGWINRFMDLSLHVKNKRCIRVDVCQPTLWSHDRLDLSILRVLQGDEGEETDRSATSGTKRKMTKQIP